VTEPPPPEEEERAPFSFRLMIVLVVIYLGWRLVQAIGWVIEQFG
jgi:hypothetical protein